MPQSRRLLQGQHDSRWFSRYAGRSKRRLLRDEGGAGRHVRPEARPDRRALFATRAIRLAPALRLREPIERIGADRRRRAFLHYSFGRNCSGSSREPGLCRQSFTLLAPLQYLESAAGASPSGRYRSVLTVRTYAFCGFPPTGSRPSCAVS